MNNYVRLLEQNRFFDQYTKTQRARKAFIDDIKSSKEGFLTWHTKVEFLLDIPSTILKQGGIVNGCEGCSKLEDVTFNLYLYDNFKPKGTARKTTVDKLTIVQTPRTSYGWNYTSKDESGRTPVDSNPSPANAVAGELDLHYNETTGKWEGGTTQTFGVLKSDIPAANDYREIDLENLSEKELLDPEVGIQASSGTAILIEMQNGNPLQWMPDFHYTKNCREKNDVNKNKKVEVTCYNISDRGYEAGENVFLSRIHGVWLVQSVGTGSTSIAPVDPKWDFMYLMTNTMFFFRNFHWAMDKKWNNLYETFNSNTLSNSLSTPDQYEQSFYRWYYNAPEVVTEGNVDIVTIYDNFNRYGPLLKPYAATLNGYLQVTSWDSMGCEIGGTRRNGFINNGVNGGLLGVTGEAAATSESFTSGRNSGGVYFTSENGNALSTTQFGINTVNEPFEEGGVGKKALSYPFFGCVFPDGYDAAVQYADLMKEEKDFFLACKDYEPFKGHISTTPFFFATSGQPFKNNNSCKDLGFSAHQEQGMFPSGEAGTLYHLPADIGTHAGPGGVNGSPVSNIGIIGELNNHLRAPDFRQIVANYFTKDDRGNQRTLSWMHKKDADKIGEVITSGEDFSYTEINSAFDLKPVNSQKIEFRPLMAEVYAQFEGFKITGSAGSMTTEPLYDYAKAISDTHQGNLSEANYRMNHVYTNQNLGDNDPTPTTSTYCLNRNPQIYFRPESIPGIPTPDFDVFYNFLLYKNASTTSGPVYNKFGLRYNYSLSAIPWGNLEPEDKSHAPDLYWNRAWMDTNVPGGGIGVIGAITTVATRDTIQFNTENAIGLDDYLNVAGDGGYPASWRGGDYKTKNTTQLFARVYQSWPRDQMIYDPRFFVVHHFNPDTNIQFDKVEQEEFDEAEEAYGNAFVDKAVSSVDFRVPTYWNNSPIPSGAGAVYADSTKARFNYETIREADPDTELIPEGFEVTGLQQVREVADWRVQPQRRGKLLPYTYTYTTIGTVPPDVAVSVLDISEDFGTVPLLNTPIMLNSRTIDCRQDILIVNRGTGYTGSSVFKTAGGNGGGVVLTPIINLANKKGEVVGFTVKNAGVGFSPDNFMATDQFISYTGGQVTIPVFDGMKVKIVQHTDTGKDPVGSGFEGYITRGHMVSSGPVTDQKPLEALELAGPIKLTPNPPLQAADTNVQAYQETDPFSQSHKVRPIAKTNSNSYDIFFHFHNDISHTWNENSNIPDPVQQMVRLEILTNASDGQSANALAANAQNQNNDAAFGNGGDNSGGAGDAFLNGDRSSNNNSNGVGGNGTFGGGGNLGGFGGGFGGRGGGGL
jgi:hypothetical protein